MPLMTEETMTGSTSAPVHEQRAILQVRGLKTHFFTGEGVLKAVDGVDLTLRRGRTLCVVGESGCGKSITARSILQIVEKPGRIVAGQILFSEPAADDEPRQIDLARLKPNGRQMRAVRGRDIAMVFQEPMSSLSAVHTIGNQIREAVRIHFKVGRAEAQARAVETLRLVGMPRPEAAVDRYPFELSGGMRQRAMIAMALVCRPSVLIADEPTTALDVTTQAQILDLLRSLQREFDMALMLITHDLGVVAELADDVAVMYLGTVVEHGTVDQIFHAPKHPYTRALLRSIPRLGMPNREERLASIPGTVPSLYARPAGCPFHTRCAAFMPGLCDRVEPAAINVGPGHDTRCLLYTPAGERYQASTGTMKTRGAT